MDKKNTSELSAEDLLRQLKENVGASDSTKPEKKYKFRRSEAHSSPVGEEEISAFMPADSGEGIFVSPVPKSDIEDLDVDELMRRFLPEEDYKRFSEKKPISEPSEEHEEVDELVRTLTEIEEVFSDSPSASDTEGEDFPPIDISEESSYTAPDSALFDTLSEGGKVCDIPSDSNEHSDDDTLIASRRKVEGLLTPEQLMALGGGDGTAVFIPEITSPKTEKEIAEVDNSGTLEIERPKDVGYKDSTLPAAEVNDTVIIQKGNAGDTAAVITDSDNGGEAADTALDGDGAEGASLKDTSDTAEGEGAAEEIRELSDGGTTLKTDSDSTYEELSDEDFDSAFDEAFDGAFDGTQDSQPENTRVLGGRNVIKPDTESMGAGGESIGANSEDAAAAAKKEEAVLSASSEENKPRSGKRGRKGKSKTEGQAAASPSSEISAEQSEKTASQLAFNFEGDTRSEGDTSAELPSGELLSDTVTEEPAAPEADLSEDELTEIEKNISRAFGMDEAGEGDSYISEEDLAMGQSSSKLRIPDNESYEKEFISQTEIKEIQEKYKLEYGKASLSFIGTVVVAVILFFYENIGIFGGSLSDIFNPQYYPIVNVMVGLQILIFGFALVGKRLIAGAVGLLNKKPIPDSMLPFMLLAAVAFSVAACFFETGSMFRTMFFPTALSLCLSAYGRRLDIRREIMSFGIVSSKRTKFAIEKLALDEADLETKAFDEYLPNQADIFKINKTNFVDGYFRRTRAYPSGKLIIGAIIPISLLLALAAFMICIFTKRGAQTGAEVSYLMFSFTVPTTLFFTYCLPSFRASKVAFADKSAIIGEVAPDEYTSAASISFDDREVFPTGGVKLRSVKVFGSGRLDTVIYSMASIYSILGGPLSSVLNVATADIGHSEDCEILSVENDGVEALVDGHHLYAGKADYLRRHGYVPVSDSSDEDIENGGDISIMFLVSDNEVIAKLYARYRIDPEFEIMLKTLYKSGICVGIKTVDPNINDSMLAARIKLDKYPVRVLKYSDVADASRGQERTDSGIVSRKSTKALLRAFTLCDKIKHLTRTNLAIGIIAMAIGVFITAGIVALSTVSAVSSVYVALYQLFWLIPMYLMAKFMIM